MVSLLDLWLPVLIATVILFLASWVLWVLLPLHKHEWKKLPDENAFFDTLKSLGVKPGQYIFPCIQMEEMKDPANKARWDAGPWGTLNLFPETPSMARNLGLSLGLFFIVSIFVGYMTAHTVQPGAEYFAIFRIAGTAAFLGYAFGGLPHDIWFCRPLDSILRHLVDAAVYALLTAGAFAGFWPGA